MHCYETHFSAKCHDSVIGKICARECVPAEMRRAEPEMVWHMRPHQAKARARFVAPRKSF